MMLRLLAIPALCALAACGPERASQPVQAKPIERACPTVKPFFNARVRKPASRLSEAQKALSGVWTNGAWDGNVCHEIYVMRIDADGSAEIFDAHGPGFGEDATGFRRRAVISEDGRMTVRKGPATVVYWIEDGKLHGERRLGTERNKIRLSRRT